MPPPDPRSGTVPPGPTCASAVGWPHQSEASIVPSEICRPCAPSYSFEVIGSKERPPAAAAPQQLLPPLVTRNAACPYFSFTTSLMLTLTTSRTTSGMTVLLFAELNEVLRIKRLIPCAALCIKKLHDVAQGIRVGDVMQKRALAFDPHQIFILELVKMVRKRGARDLEFVLNLGDDQAFRVRGKQQLHDAQPRLGAHGRKHVGVARDTLAVRPKLVGGTDHMSIVLEIWIPVKSLVETRLAASLLCTTTNDGETGASPVHPEGRTEPSHHQLSHTHRPPTIVRSIGILMMLYGSSLNT